MTGNVAAMMLLAHFLSASRIELNIIMHVSGLSGYHPNSVSVFRSGQKSGVRHSALDTVDWTFWPRNKIIPNLSAAKLSFCDILSQYAVKQVASVKLYGGFNESLATGKWNKDLAFLNT
jgi:hypothetical protein